MPNPIYFFRANRELLANDQLGAHGAGKTGNATTLEVVNIGRPGSYKCSEKARKESCENSQYSTLSRGTITPLALACWHGEFSLGVFPAKTATLSPCMGGGGVGKIIDQETGLASQSLQWTLQGQ